MVGESGKSKAHRQDQDVRAEREARAMPWRTWSIRARGLCWL